MNTILNLEGARRALLDRPAPSTCPEALVFAVGESEAVRPAVERFSRSRDSTAAPDGALEAVLAYVERNRARGAALLPLYPERAAGLVAPADGPGAGNHLAIPDLRSRTTSLSAYHYLRLAEREPGADADTDSLLLALEMAALLPNEVITTVHRPAIERPEPMDPDGPDAQQGIPQWGLDACGFRHVWKCFRGGSGPGPIAVVDMGGNNGHPDLQSAIVKVREPATGMPSDSDHASIVVGVLAARRGQCRMNGCCPATVHLYNVGVGEQLDCLSYYLALKEIAGDPDVRVVNLSLESRDFDPLIALQVEDCIQRGKILVAAAGNTGTAAPVYPGAYPGVIAVGGINQSFDRYSRSTIGGHILVAAPAEWIFSVSGPGGCDKRNNGTSFAAPMVSAAVWLALSARPGMGLAEVTKLLSQSVHGNGRHTPELGHGVLNMREMVRLLSPLSGCP